MIVIAATNRPDIIDPALLRPGRLDRLILIPAPDERARLEIFKIHTQNMPLAPDVDLERLAALTEGYSGSDIEAVCREAGMLVLRECVAQSASVKGKQIGWRHFERAMEKVRPSLTEESILPFAPLRSHMVHEKGIEFVHLDALPPEERSRFMEIAGKAAEMLGIRKCTISFCSPVGTSVEIGGKIYIEPTQTTLNLSDEGLTGLFLHELAHSRYRMLGAKTREALLSYKSRRRLGQWAIKLLEDLLLNDLLYSKGFGNLLTATDLDSLKMLKPQLIEKFEAVKTKVRFITMLSLIGSYLDGKRYNNSELVELVKQHLERLPDYVKEATLRTYDIIKNIPILKDVSETKKLDMMRIGKDLISCWEKYYR